MSSLKQVDKIKLEKLFGMNTGYVCDFWDSTFGEFVKENTGIDVYTEEYARGGTSKANRLRTFWKKESDELTAKLVGALLEYWRTLQLVSGQDMQLSDHHLYLEGLKIIKNLESGGATSNNKITTGIVDEPNAKQVFNVQGSQLHFGKGDNIEQNKNINPKTNFFHKYWREFFLTVIAGVTIFIITEGKIPQIFNKNNGLNSEIQNTQNILKGSNLIKDNLRSLEPLETGKNISKLPDNTYFYALSTSIVYEIENTKEDFLQATNDYFNNYSFEIQKISNRYYLVGSISDEAYSNIGSVSTNNPLYTILFPKSWGGATHYIAIPFDKIYTIKSRTINLDENTKMDVFDIGFKEVKDYPDTHIK
ncbi:MAG: hypothetical protein G01um101424_43 [Parcubacteria group bacterium Gr01-1014_24]|nr:MAG: hypothetical protein G01um101424_43 [Parcubacteria group bacterium Gr01-1014_24]